MEAIVLAGGFGTRLKEVVPDLPKPMAPVAGRPFLEILLSMLAGKGFTRVVLSLGFMSEKIISHFGDNYLGMDLIYEVERQPLGTGGAIRAALARCEEDHAFIFNGDTYLELEVDELEKLWQRNNNPVIVVREVPDTARGEFVWQGAYIFDLSLDGIELRGRVSHDDSNIDYNDYSYYWGNWNTAIKRTLYMDNVLYTISNSKIVASDLELVSSPGMFLKQIKELIINELDYPTHYWAE